MRAPGAALVGVAMGAWLVAGACRTVREPRPVATPKPGSARPALESLVSEPSVRVGILVNVPRVSIRAPSGVVVYGTSVYDGPGEGRTVARATFQAVATGMPAAPRFRVQVASLAAESGAQNVAARVQETVQATPTLQWNALTGTHQVRVGGFATRDEALRLANRLSRSGLPGAFVVEEPGPTGPGRMRLLETGEELRAATVVSAAPDELLAADGAPYRGILEVRAGEDGGLTVVDVANVEDYLRGVVPNELSPMAFPQPEALKAQAVAARSYVLNHKGEFAARGYDICATAACQVYRGQATEHEMTDRAVAETRGLVASWRGRPINAYYTATCGGHTEDSENVFDGNGIPYLKGVACAPERTAWTTLHTAASARTLSLEPPPGLIAAEFAGAVAGQVTILRGEQPESFPLDPAARLFRSLDGVRAAASELRLVVGDRVNLVLADGQVVFLEAEQTRKGAAADRGSRYYRWVVRLTPTELTRSLERYREIGAVRDLVPRRLGVSGRVVELAVQGTHGEVVLKGMRIRAALGLRENLFVIEREKDVTGAVKRFVITGKGWGHGVGLCQVGAFGMAQSGSSFEQILQHYYRGIRLERAYRSD